MGRLSNVSSGWLAAMACVVILTGVCGPGAGSVRAAGTPQYLGEFCWSANGGLDMVRLGITHLGDTHFLVTGTVVETSGTVNVVNGNMEIVNGEILMHITSSCIAPKDNATYSGTVVLDINTLNGYVEGVGIYADRTSGQTGTSYDGTQTLTFTTCN